MDYEKKYNESMLRAEEAVQKGCLDNDMFDIIFPSEESEDERIRKAIVCGMNVLKEQKKETFAAVPINDCLAWLEKQKDILGERAKNITANMFEDGIKGIQRELIEFLSNTVNASWVDIIRSADAYAERIRNTIKKQKEQKPTEWKPTEEQLNYLAKAIMTLGEEGDCKTAGVLSEIRKGLKCSFPDWKVSPDYPEEGCNVSLNGEVKKIQEWSEEDEKILELVTDCVYEFYPDPVMKYKLKDWLTQRLKSLRPQPQWKPSEEQMEAIKHAYNSFPDYCPTKLGLKTLYEQLKKL